MSRLKPKAEPAAEASAPEPEDGGPAVPALLDVEVDVRELEQFRTAAGALQRARGFADELPAEATSENKGQFADALKELRDADRDAEETRKQLTRKFDDAKKRVKAGFDELRSSVSAARESVEDRLLIVERIERQAEEERLKAAEEEQQRKQAEENEAAEAEQRNSKYVPPAAPRRRVKGARGASGAKASPRPELKYRIVDENALPEEYKKWEPNRSRILEGVRNGEVIPGVEPYEDERVQVG